MRPAKAISHRLLRDMKLIRAVEEGIASRYDKGEMRCPTHLSIGQEASAVGVCSALDSSDLAVSTHRGHAHYLAKGGSVRAMLAEIYGKESGCSRGRGGSMHLVDTSVGFMGTTAIVGNSLPVGVGLALALKFRGENNIAVVFLGDGCAEEGVFYESLNFAAVRNVPVFFVCENNYYSVYSNLSARQPKGRRIYELASAIGLESRLADGNDVKAVYETAKSAVDYVRRGHKPFFLELETYRVLEHCGPNNDDHLNYRDPAEVQHWATKDPIVGYQNQLLLDRSIDEQTLEQLDKEVATIAHDGFAFAEQSAFPDPLQAFQGIFSG